MPRSLLGRISFGFVALAVLLAGLVWAGLLSVEASYSSGGAPASPPPPAAAPVADVRSTAGAIAAAEVAGRDLVACVRARGLRACHTAAGIHDPRGAGAPLVARSFDDYSRAWASRVVVVPAGRGLAAMAFDADSLGVGYLVDGEKQAVRPLCVILRGKCKRNVEVAAFLNDEARLAEVTRRASKIG